jgi:adenosylhomocysteine nucleosidase
MMEPQLPPILVVMALEIEAPGAFQQQRVPVLYTGVGKVNAAMSLTRRLAQYRIASLPPPLVINFGKAVPAQLDFPRVFTHLPTALCGSGDSFETGVPRVHCEVIDMEAYALAKVCHLEGVRFGCAKYVTDGADHVASSDWQSNLRRAGADFWRLYQDLRCGVA